MQLFKVNLKNTSGITNVLAGIISSAFLVSFFIAIRYFHYVSAPGGDLLNHVSIAYDLRDHGIRVFLSGYPKLFHLLLLLGIYVSGHNPLWVMLYMLPFVVTLSGLAAYVLMKKVSNGWVGLFALILTLFVSQQPLQTLYDGGFPNFISTTVWLPLVLLGVAYLENQKTHKKGMVLTAIGSILMLFTHHFSVLYLGALLIVGIGVLPIRIRRIAITFMISCFIFFLLPIDSGVHSLLTTIVQFGNGFPWIHLIGKLSDPNALLPLRAYPDYFTPFIWYGGILTLCGVFVGWYRKSSIPLVIRMLSLLAALLLIFSQVPEVGFPVRLARDAGLPLLLLTAYGLGAVVNYWKDIFWVRPILLLVVVFLLIVPISVKVQRFTHFEPTMQYTPAQQEMALRVKGQNAVYLDNALTQIAFPNVHSIIAEQLTESVLKRLIHEASYVLVDASNPHLPYYESLLASENYHYIAEGNDPVKRVLLYHR
jgi:hypothetical protein